MSIIDDKYVELGGPAGFLGQPTTGELVTPNGLGHYRHFQHGSIYHKLELSIAAEVHGLIRDRWAELGWENSFLGFPLTDEIDVEGVSGRTNTFEGGVISWSPSTGAHEVHGAILERWMELGREAGFGFPLTDETSTPDGRGRFNHFTGGSIYWTPETGAVEIVGAMKSRWASAGWEQSSLGYPVAPEFIPPPDGVTLQDFEHGYLAMQTNLEASSRIVIQSQRVFTAPGTMISWDDFRAPFPNGDRIFADIDPGGNPNRSITLTLNASAVVNTWRSVRLWSVTRGTIREASTEGSRDHSTITLQASEIQENDTFIVFQKAAFLGIHEDMYWLRPTRVLLGHNVTFSWTA